MKNLPCLVKRWDPLVPVVAGLFVLLDVDVMLEGVVERGVSCTVLLPVIDIPLPRLAGVFGVVAYVRNNSIVLF